ncbi:very-short-patch-repair endonuclease [Kribbella aluminosa]|uniref:Very-short-patch-repair endonuclease n=1 Tax=Kribbella aluminosa TaxID=416017 RepID=A0ABS4UDA6_9ACTN|nr:hypothetical protein [Kribbella aluminosa]MBP2349613.1 very-short-patch-repair endonuclease [Kribbella aluminosa]
MTSVVEVLARLGGWSTAAVLVQLTSRRALAAAVRRGEVERLTRGIYGLPGIATDLATAVAYDGVLSHLSAAAIWQLPLLHTPEKPHLILPRNRKARAGPPAVLHWADLPGTDRRARRTSLPRTVLDCARILPFGEALAVADAALATGLMNADELVASAGAMSGPGRPNAVRVAAAAIRFAESFLESILRSLLIEAGVEGFEAQVLVETDGGWVRVDLGNRVALIALEAEGFEFHGSAGKFAADCRRYDDLVAVGWLVLRFTYQQIFGDPRWVVATVMGAVAQRVGVPKNG